jgi:hypothetical protein
VSALAALQREFLAAIFEAQGAPSAGLDIYRRSVLANLRAALAAAYPVVRRLVGDAFFGEAAQQYVRGTPSASGDLHRYGERFARFLEDYPHARALPYLPDVARLEWLCHESYHAADAPPFDFAALARVAEPRRGAIRFVLDPAARMMRSPHPVAAIWEANQPGRDGTPDRDAGPDCILVRRALHTVRVTRVAEFEWEFLARIAGGAPLEAAAGALSGRDAHALLGGALARYVADGVITGFAAPAGEA